MMVSSVIRGFTPSCRCGDILPQRGRQGFNGTLQAIVDFIYARDTARYPGNVAKALLFEGGKPP